MTVPDFELYWRFAWCEKMKNEDASEHLIPPHGGYSKLVTYKIGLLIYDATVAFCEHYLDRKDRTFDQMV